MYEICGCEREMRFYLETLGCRLNYSEMERLARELTSRGHHVVHAPEDADVCVLNTCAVTTQAEAKSRSLARSLHRANPRARLAITGCYATLSPEAVKKLPGVIWVADNAQKDALADLWTSSGASVELGMDASSGLDDGAFPELTPEEITRPDRAPFAHTRTRAFVKVQDGCNNRCTFCIVTIARGQERSRPLADVVAEIRRLEAEGFREAVLTGVHLGAYGRDLGTSLAALVRAILRETTIPRLRLSSLEPWDLADDFFDLWRESDGRLCPHLHLPLQSGCDATLRRMARRYTTADYARLVDVARARIGDLTVTTDIIVGFPGETDEEFEASARFVESMGFAHLHVFPYSPRPGTAAARMKGHVSEPVKRKRSAIMREIDRRCGHAVRRAQLGRTCEVLWESHGQEIGDGSHLLWTGLTDNYLRILTTTDRSVDLHNHITRVRVARLEGDALWGEIDQ